MFAAAGRAVLSAVTCATWLIFGLLITYPALRIVMAVLEGPVIAPVDIAWLLTAILVLFGTYAGLMWLIRPHLRHNRLIFGAVFLVSLYAVASAQIMLRPHEPAVIQYAQGHLRLVFLAVMAWLALTAGHLYLMWQGRLAEFNLLTAGISAALKDSNDFEDVASANFSQRGHMIIADTLLGASVTIISRLNVARLAISIDSSTDDALVYRPLQSHLSLWRFRPGEMPEPGEVRRQVLSACDELIRQETSLGETNQAAHRIEFICARLEMKGWPGVRSQESQGHWEIRSSNVLHYFRSTNLSALAWEIITFDETGTVKATVPFTVWRPNPEAEADFRRLADSISTVWAADRTKLESP
jgi:hypothetical protein